MVEVRCSPRCEICGGVGFVRYDLPVVDQGFGKVFPCPNLDRVKFPQHDCGLAENELILSWEQLLDLNGALEIARKIRDLKSGQIYLFGDYGLGKTHILKTAVSQAVKAGRQAHYLTTTGFLDDLRLSFDAENPNTSIYGRLRFWSSVPLLALDELDRESATPFAQERLSQVLDERWQGAIAGRLVTLLASNSRPEELPDILIQESRTAVAKSSKWLV